MMTLLRTSTSSNRLALFIVVLHPALPRDRAQSYTAPGMISNLDGINPDATTESEQDTG